MPSRKRIRRKNIPSKNRRTSHNSIVQLWRESSVVTRKDTSWKNVPRRKNGRMIWLRSTSWSYIMMFGYEFKTWREVLWILSNRSTRSSIPQIKVSKDTKQGLWFLSERESRLWKDTSLGARHTSSVMNITLDSWCNQNIRTNWETYRV